MSPCFRIPNGIICYNRFYAYKGIRFEMGYGFVARVNKDLEPSRRGEGRKFWKVFVQWQKLPPSKRKRTEI